MYCENWRLFFSWATNKHTHTKANYNQSQREHEAIFLFSIEIEAAKFISFEKEIKVYAAPPHPPAKKKAGKESVTDVVQAAN